MAAENREAILLVLITTLITGILVGVFFQRIANQIANWLGKLFHFLFDRFASTPFIRWRYEKRYRETLAAAVQELQGGNLVDRVIRLDQMYVQSLLTEETRPAGWSQPGTLADRFRTRDEMRRRQKERAVGPWEAVQRFPRFVVLGAPGVGKTTYLHHLAFMCAHRRRAEVRNHLPIFIRFRELVRDLSQVERLEEILPGVLADYHFPNAEKFLERQLANGRCLVLLDGLDEVANEANQERLISLVQAFADRHAGGQNKGQNHNIVVVSSRKYSYEHGPQLVGFAKTEVMEFDRPAVERFVYNWFRASANGAGESVLAGELLAALQGNQRFLELARNPLLLLLIAAHYERERNLPQLRAELYRHCIRTRITTWNTVRGTHRGRFGEEDKWRLLRELALFAFQQEGEGLLRREQLLEWLAVFGEQARLPADAEASVLLEEVTRTSGLIQEWAIDRYGFSHQTLQEYFAAEAIQRKDSEEGAALLELYLDHPGWKEVILLYCGLADNAGPFLRRVIDYGRRHEGEPAPWLLAGRCLAEGARLVPRPLRREVAEGLLDCLRGRSLTLAEREAAIADLRDFANDWLPEMTHRLLQQEQPDDLLLAANLWTDEAADQQAELQQRLVALARVADGEQRQAAVAALGRVGADDTAAVVTLLERLADLNPGVRAETAYALGRLGAETTFVRPDEGVVAALLRLYHEDPADEPRQAALQALLALGCAAEVGMVLVPAGEFLMGSNSQDKEASDKEKPQHRLYLPAYYIDRTPVTNRAFRQFIIAGGYANPAYWTEAIAAGRWKKGKYVEYDGKLRSQPWLWDDDKWNGNEQPVVGVSWYEALAYTRWAGKRLPTEAEWEKAARGEDGRLYPWGNQWDPTLLNSKEGGANKTTLVGRHSPLGDSPYGVADMVGNVWEWCSTRWWDDKGKEYGYPYTPDDGREDLSGGDDVARVLRGGAWYNEKQLTRCAARYGYDPRGWGLNWGFRCCCATSSLLSSSEF